MLHPGREEDYVRFLEIRKTPITPLEKPQISISEKDAAAAVDQIRKFAKTDRAIYDKAQKAFVSWVRSYGAHQATSIFRVSDLDWIDLANAWGLLRMPRMPELKNWKGDKTLGVEMDWDTFAYKEKTREKARIEEMEAAKNGEGIEKDDKKRKRKNEAWSGKHQQQEQRNERREKRHKKKEAEKNANMTDDQKLEKMKLDDLIKQVRERNRAKAASKDDEFEGFDD
ncbi:ATP-dependent rRNA helicase spb4 [Metarhizium acridum]|nr:ATP-dependent rRNA helicase spb4 [Metarhizium acridum]